jgi:hypothetical protein
MLEREREKERWAEKGEEEGKEHKYISCAKVLQHTKPQESC